MSLSGVDEFAFDGGSNVLLCLICLLLQDALRAKRNQEAMERSWRQKEKEEAVKQAETNSILKKTRLEQVAQKEHYLAVQAQRDRAEFDRVLRYGER